MSVGDSFKKYAEGETLEVDGIVRFAEEELGIAADDVAVYILAWKLNAENPASIALSEWTTGMAKLGCKTTADLKKRLDSLRAEIAVKTNFTDFYKWVFRWSKEQRTARYIKKDSAIALWELLLPLIPNVHWKLTSDWLVFMNDKFATKTITEDLWNQLLVWIHTPNSDDLSKYDEEAAWPAAIDQFVEYKKSQK